MQHLHLLPPKLLQLTALQHLSVVLTAAAFGSHLAAPAAPVPAVYTYTSNTTRHTYILNTNYMNASAAQQYCNDSGGHLAGWDNRAEQSEVEQYYIEQVSRL